MRAGKYNYGGSGMIYLILAIVSSMLVSVLMRLSEGKSRGGAALLAMNYLMCCVLAYIFTGTTDLFPAEDGLPLTIVLGIIGGLFYLGAFILLQWNISRNGVVLPATFMKLGVLVPTLMAIIIFGEAPRLTQILGVIAAVAAILIINGGKGKQQAGSVPGLVLLLLAGGGADGMSKIYEESGTPALKDHFLLYIFIVAFILCLVLCVARRQKIGVHELLFGAAIGVPNYLSSRFLLLALSDVPAVVAFPTYSVATIVLVTLAGVFCFREKLEKRKLTALAIILAALVLLNV